jgi:chromosomal replication initiation ATPase DnaA
MKQSDYTTIEVKFANYELIELQWLAAKTQKDVDTIIRTAVRQSMTSEHRDEISLSLNNTIENVMYACMRTYNVSREQLTARVRFKEFVEPRHMMYYILRTRYHLKYEYMGKKFGYNCATIIQAVKKIDGYIKAYTLVRYNYETAIAYLE